jgi:flagellar hook assembly protein FlgD
VRTLETGGEQYAGDHAVRFDGLGDSGKPLPTGIYLFRVETADGELTTKAAILH